MIKESYDVVKQKNYKSALSATLLKRKDIHNVRCVQTGEIFHGYVEPRKKYNAKLASYFSAKNHNKKIYTYGGCLDDGTKLDWIIIDEESA